MSDHDHDHDHGPSVHGETKTMAGRVATLLGELEAKGIVTTAQVDTGIERFLAHATPANGARIVARAWVDEDFRDRLLADANAALDELGIDMSHWARVKLRALANTETLHNVIVCTLCSCYPVGLLGPSPTWYKSLAYRSRVVREPRAVLEELGVRLPEAVDIRVWDSTAELRYIVLPRRPAGTERLSEPELAALVTRDALIGAGLCQAP
jgi:nitrile hydratase